MHLYLKIQQKLYSILRSCKTAQFCHLTGLTKVWSNQQKPWIQFNINSIFHNPGSVWMRWRRRLPSRWTTRESDRGRRRRSSAASASPPTACPGAQSLWMSITLFYRSKSWEFTNCINTVQICDKRQILSWVTSWLPLAPEIKLPKPRLRFLSLYVVRTSHKLHSVGFIRNFVKVS